MSAALHRFFAICPRGLDGVLADELRALGATHLAPEPGGVGFAGSLVIAYAANLHSRIASRVLWQVGRRPYASEDDVYHAAYAVPWDDHMTPQQTLRVDVNASNSPLRSLEFAMLKVKDGIVDRLRDRRGERPSIDRTRPDVRVFAFLDHEAVTLYLDLSGVTMLKVGRRCKKGEAPLGAYLEAGVLLLSGCCWRAPAQRLLPLLLPLLLLPSRPRSQPGCFSAGCSGCIAAGFRVSTTFKDCSDYSSRIIKVSSQQYGPSGLGACSKTCSIIHAHRSCDAGSRV